MNSTYKGGSQLLNLEIQLIDNAKLTNKAQKILSRNLLYLALERSCKRLSSSFKFWLTAVLAMGFDCGVDAATENKFGFSFISTFRKYQVKVYLKKELSYLIMLKIINRFSIQFYLASN